MIAAIIYLATQVSQQPALTSISVFEGGTYDKYLRFAFRNRAIPVGLNIYQEQLFTAMGPCRALKFSDGSIKLDPPLPPFLKSGSQGRYGFIKSSIFPTPYCRLVDPLEPKPSLEDKVSFLDVEDKNNAAPGIRASLVLGNNLPELGYRTIIHPFFKEMRVNVACSGNWQPDILDAVASCVGARVEKELSVPTTYRLEPDVEEIRSRALATLDFFTPSTWGEAMNSREKIRYELIQTCSHEFLKRWIDAAGKPDSITTTDREFMTKIAKYRDKAFAEFRKQSPNMPILKQFDQDAIKAMPVVVRLTGYLNLEIMLMTPEGIPIHI